MRRTIPIMLCLSLALIGCKAKKADQASISKDLDRRGTTDLMKEIAKDKYTAPSDGRLTDAQVRMYLEVREHEKKIAEVAKAELKQHAEKADKSGNRSIGGFMDGMKALGSAADLLTADIRAAKDLGYNTQEYLWIKQQILTVSTSQIAEQFSSAMSQNVDKAYEQAKKAHDQAKDEQTRQFYAKMIEGYDKTRQEAGARVEADPALAYNKQLLSKYENVLNAFAHEIQKFETKPGEAQKAVDEIQNIGQQN